MILFSVSLVLLTSLVTPRTLMAHANLVKSEPAASSTGPAPQQIRLTFSEELMVAMTRVLVITPKGDTIIGLPRVDTADSHKVDVDLHGFNAGGTYTVKWSVAARDGHPSHGSFNFTVIPPTNPQPLIISVPDVRRAPDSSLKGMTIKKQIAVEENQGMAGDNSIGMIIVRWLAFLSTFLIVGVVTFRLYLLRQSAFADSGTFVEIASGNAATLGLFAAFGMLVSLLLKIARESSDLPDVSMRTMLFASTWGWALCCAVFVALAAILAFALAARHRAAASLHWWRVAQIAAAVLVITPALSGHAIGNDRPWLTVPNDILHVAAGSIWLGTLAVIVIVGISAALKTPDSTPASARIAQLINTFSPMALTCGAIVVGTGIVASLIHLPRINALWTTPYGSALYRKLIFVLLLFAVGAWNWRRTKPRLNVGDGGLVSLKRVATVEIVLSAVVLLLTAILVALAIPE